MGKKGRRTRWRTLTITDEHSDSEESNTTSSGHRVPKGYPQKSYYSRFTYSSQSTPTRRYQCDGTKSTRSSSTASENKITFNEDEYTRITTPRQDVLFKKGYLNKPKTYQTQTSTGNSTTSTGNSTGNGTPDHQSTDLEYESQFVFPNGFVDQNGIYYVNSFEPYPVMVYNPPTYYQEYTSVKTKRCSTGSLTESTSPNNEETSQSETPSNVSAELNPVYNVVYPGFYYNGVCQPQSDAVSEPEPRRVKKRRRRKLSRSKSTQEGTTSDSSDEVFSEEEKPPEQAEPEPEQPKEEEEEEGEKVEEKKDEAEEKDAQEEETPTSNDCPKTKYDLKPDAEEFVPRAYRQPETIPIEANVQYIKIPSNFVPVPILNPMSDFNAFIPPGIPINFIPHQSFINYVPYKTPNVQVDEKPTEKPEEEVKETVEVPKNQIDIAKIVSKLEEAAKEQDETSAKEETHSNSKVTRKRHRYQKVELRKPPPSPEPKEWKKPVWKPQSPAKETMRPVKNYSDTLKKSVTLTQGERHERNMDKIKSKPPVKETVKNHRIEQTQPKMVDEWISVSSRKKRKNKNIEVEVEETENLEEEVVVNEELISEPVQEPLPQPVQEPVEVIEPPPPPPPQPIVVEEIKEEKKVKKKTKKHGPKTPPPQVTKRVIIKDIDLSLEEVKEDIKEEPKAEPEPAPVPPPSPVEVPVPIIEESPNEVVVETTEVKIAEGEKEKPVEKVEEEKPVEEVVQKKESPEKKTKKKKKKVAKTANLGSHSSSNTTLNVADDSYDFLLDESLEKTNVEMSQELDKMIQRGMYSNLEEKIKSMNIESNDNFFKSIINNISSREPSVEKNSYIKNPDLSKLLTNTSLIKPKTTFDRKAGDFLGEATPKHLGGGDTDEATRDENLYPITNAVKEWMTKTRENTPDVELLKSPSTIFREFGEEGDEVTVYSRDDVRKTSTSSVEEGEDVIEAYDSKYGLNEDFLKIKAEVEEKKGSYPKHGNLPYRAICCSIM